MRSERMRAVLSMPGLRRDEVEALRLKANRFQAIGRGKLISEMPPATAKLDLDGTAHEGDFHLKRSV